MLPLLYVNMDLVNLKEHHCTYLRVVPIYRSSTSFKFLITGILWENIDVASKFWLTWVIAIFKISFFKLKTKVKEKGARQK